jgi:hypothetical protein
VQKVDKNRDFTYDVSTMGFFFWTVTCSISGSLPSSYRISGLARGIDRFNPQDVIPEPSIEFRICDQGGGFLALALNWPEEVGLAIPVRSAGGRDVRTMADASFVPALVYPNPPPLGFGSGKAYTIPSLALLAGSSSYPFWDGRASWKDRSLPGRVAR